MATMNAPVATNRLNLAFATKKITSGPSSVASLNSGCGVVLSIRHLFVAVIIRPRVSPKASPGLTRKPKIQSLQSPAQTPERCTARDAVELCHHQARDPCDTMKRLDLRQRILSHGGVEYQQHRMRRRRIDLLDDAHDFFELLHQFGLVLQPTGGVDQEHVELSVPRR